MDTRHTALAALTLTCCSVALADNPAFNLTPIPPVPSAPNERLNPVFINAAGQVAGVYGDSSATRAFLFSGGTTIDLHPSSELSTSGVLALNDAGQALVHGCVPAASGFGCSGHWWVRHSPGVGDLRLDLFPNAPAAGYPWAMNALGEVAVADQPSGQSPRLMLFTDADGGGWVDLMPLFPPGTPMLQPVAFTDAGLLVAPVGGIPAYLYSNGAVTPLFASGVFSYAMNNAGVLTGLANFPGAGYHPFRGTSPSNIQDLDPTGSLNGATGTHINDSGMVAGHCSGGFFTYSDETGLVNLGRVTTTTLDGTLAVTSLNNRGELIAWEQEQNYDVDPIIYETWPVIKLQGQPLQKVQDVVDPNFQRLHVAYVSALNDSGQFAISGPSTVTNGFVAFLVTPVEGGCPADFDGNGTLAVPDIFAFLAAWFAQAPAADFDGVNGIAVPDIFAFLSAWFAGCD